MELQNGYVIMYNAPERVTEEKQGPVYASKALPSIDDAMLISYDNAGNYIDLKSFNLIYSDGTHLLGSVSGVPSTEDVNILIKAGTELVFGEQITAAEETAEQSVVTAPKRSTRRTNTAKEIKEPEKAIETAEEVVAE